MPQIYMALFILLHSNIYVCNYFSVILPSESKWGYGEKFLNGEKLHPLPCITEVVFENKSFATGTGLVQAVFLWNKMGTE